MEEMRCEVLICRKESLLSEDLHEDWCEELADDGRGLCESAEIVDISLTERLKVRRQMAAAGKKESLSLSLFMEVNNLEVEEDLWRWQ